MTKLLLITGKSIEVIGESALAWIQRGETALMGANDG